MRSSIYIRGTQLGNRIVQSSSTSSMASSPSSHEVQVHVISCDTNEGGDSNPKLRLVMRIAYPFKCHGRLLAMERSTRVAVHVVRPAAAAGPSTSNNQDSTFIWNDLIVMPILRDVAESAVLFFEVSLDGGATGNPFAFARLPLRDVVDEVGDGGGEASRALELIYLSGELLYRTLHVRVAVKESGGGHEPSSPLPPVSAAYGPAAAPVLVVEVTVISGTGLPSVNRRKGKFLPCVAVWISQAAYWQPVTQFTKIAADDEPSLFGNEYKVRTWNETLSLPLLSVAAVEDAVVNLEVVDDSASAPEVPFGYGSIPLQEVIDEAGIGRKVYRVVDLSHPSEIGGLAQAKVKVAIAVKGCNFHGVPYDVQQPELVDHFPAAGEIDGRYYTWTPAYEYDGGQKTSEGMDSADEKMIDVVYEDSDVEDLR